MNDSTRHILRWCAGGNRGMRTNLARLLSHGRLAGTGHDRASIRGWERCPARTTAPDKNSPAREAQVSSNSFTNRCRARSRHQSMKRVTHYSTAERN